LQLIDSYGFCLRQSCCPLLWQRLVSR